VVEQVKIEEDGAVVVEARARVRERSRCGLCGRRCPGYDQGAGRRRWRALDLGATKAFVEAEAPRVTCRRHGVVVARVPWARHDSWFTRAFEDEAAWLATHCSKSAVCELLRVSWYAVGAMIERVVADESAKRGDPLGRPAADRDRRALLSQGPALHHRRRLPRHRQAGLGRRGQGQADGRALLQ